MANTLFVLNDPPYGTERSYNGLRLAVSLAKREGESVRIFLMGDAASCAKAGQKVPQGYYRLEAMLQVASRQGAGIAACGTCMEARGITDSELTDGVVRGTLEQLADWTVWADRALVF
jgi:uncharacterized protein involved in oxidation of intracellular sulfur